MAHKITYQELKSCAVHKTCRRDGYIELLISITPTYYTLKKKNAGLFYPNFGSSMDKPKHWVKNII